MLLCVSLVWPTKFANTLSFMQNWFDDWKFMENARNFNFGKIGLNSGKIGLNSLFFKIISSHTHAFCSSISMLWVVPKFFFKKLCFFLKILWASTSFDWSNLFFDQSKLFWNFLKKPLSVSINRSCFSINRNSWIKFLKNDIWLVQTTFSKLFLSPTWQGSTTIFFVIFFQISCKVSLSISWYVHITLSFALFSCFHALFHGFWVNFWTMHKLGFLINQALFCEFDQWVLLLQWYIHNLYWLLWSIWGFVKN